MNLSALIMMIFGLTITWGGALICLLIAILKRDKKKS